jgi:hypothetical protein
LNDLCDLNYSRLRESFLERVMFEFEEEPKISKNEHGGKRNLTWGRLFQHGPSPCGEGGL